MPADPTLFDAPPASASDLPTALAVIASGLTPMQWFDRRYPRARCLRSQVLKDVVREGVAAPSARAAWDAWYREHYGPPVEVPIPASTRSTPSTVSTVPTAQELA